CDGISEVQRRHSAFEAPRVHAPELHRHEALLSPDLLDQGKIADGRQLTLDDFRAAWRRAEAMRAAAQEWAGGFDAILTLPAAEAIARLASGALTAEELTRACLQRAEERRSVKAWTWLDPEQALAQAHAADRAGRPGLLSGLPIGVKDIIDTVDMPTEHGSPI